MTETVKPRSSFARTNRVGGIVSEEDLIGFIYSRDGLTTFKEVMAGFDIPRGHRKEVQNLLTALCSQKVLFQDDDGFYSIRRKEDFVEGMLSVNPRGFAFATVSEPPPGVVIEQDVFIPERELSSATHGDKVLLRIVASRRGRMEGVIIKVLERGTTVLVGDYMSGRSTGLVYPEDDRFPFQVLVRKENSMGAKNGESVVVEIEHYTPGKRNPDGKIIEILGDPDDIAVQNEIVIRKFQLPFKFSPKAMDYVAALDENIVMEKGRLDLRDIQHVTIDGETARDFDDAVAVIKTRSGFRLYVSIADVSHYVKPGTALDLEAYLRGTSVYFPTRVVPMLPEKLSNNLCSLVPEQDRYSFTAILDFDGNGTRKEMQFSKSIIRSRYRLTYTIVKKILVDKDDESRRQYHDILENLEYMGALALLLEQKRMDRGSIGFEIPEAEVAIDENGEISGINRLERNRAHKLIEEFMLAANEAVAEKLSTGFDKKNAALYRIHEKPDPIKVAVFSGFGRTMGLKLPGDSGSPVWFGKVLDLTRGTPQEYIVNNLLLRTMKQAKYSPDNVGHFGLAADFYTHFTSPIRRYPDLMVHRKLSELLGSGADETPVSADEAGLFLSKRERVAVDAEREMVDRLKVRFMAGREGEVFDGIISGVTTFGLFIELLDTFIGGAIELTALKDDYYQYEEESHRLLGRRTGKIFRLGDLLRVKLESVDKRKRHINFVIAEEKEHG
ncbi:MAG: ribonuclease R [Proteobacteria bacterium]|nr:ribonuclease R [Pseudomonadota bacterium]MBU1708565.1 ribonuclease R [Pseudomonadota bacterium]